MNGISEEDVQHVKALVNSIAPTLVLIVRGAWRSWTTNHLPLLPNCPIRVRRSVMWALTLQEAKLQFGEIDEVSVRETWWGHVLFILRGPQKARSIILRFKHLHGDFSTRNYPTVASLKYNLQLPLPLIPRGTRITIGYTLSQDETQLTGIYWVWSVGTHLLYHESLIESDRPAELIPAGRPAGAARVRPKRGKDEKSGSED